MSLSPGGSGGGFGRRTGGYDGYPGYSRRDVDGSRPEFGPGAVMSPQLPDYGFGLGSQQQGYGFGFGGQYGQGMISTGKFVVSSPIITVTK